MAAASSNSLSDTADSHDILPRNVVMIIERLPVKSLIRFKSVSKSFCKYISSPEFHFLNCKSQIRPRLILRLPDPGFFKNVSENFRFVSNFCMTDLEGNMLSRFDVMLHQETVKLMLPSCMGLICFATNKEIWLCNPSINKLLELPPSDLKGERLLGFGFGYLESIMGFKVVRLMTRASGDGLRPKIDGWVFTLPWDGGNRSWRLMKEKCPYLVPEYSYPAFAKESIYWKIDRCRYSKLARDNDFMVAFNIREEKFRVVTHPVDWTDSAGSKTHTVGTNEKLALVRISDFCVTLWFLEEEVNCIWTAQIRVCESLMARQVRLAELKFCIGGDDKLLFSSEANTVVLYCRKQGTFSLVALPFDVAEFTLYFECLYPLIRS